MTWLVWIPLCGAGLIIIGLKQRLWRQEQMLQLQDKEIDALLRKNQVLLLRLDALRTFIEKGK